MRLHDDPIISFAISVTLLARWAYRLRNYEPMGVEYYVLFH